MRAAAARETRYQGMTPRARDEERREPGPRFASSGRGPFDVLPGPAMVNMEAAAPR